MRIFLVSFLMVAHLKALTEPSALNALSFSKIYDRSTTYTPHSLVIRGKWYFSDTNSASSHWDDQNNTVIDTIQHAYKDVGDQSILSNTLISQDSGEWHGTWPDRNWVPYTYPVGGTVTVTPKRLSVTAANLSVFQGDPIGTLAYSQVGLINGDSFSGVLATNATTRQSVTGRTLAFTPSVSDILQGTLDAGSNYILSFTPAKLTIHCIYPIFLWGWKPYLYSPWYKAQISNWLTKAKAIWGENILRPQTFMYNLYVRPYSSSSTK